MWLTSLLGVWRSHRGGARPAPGRPLRRRMTVEVLEDRTVPSAATISVFATGLDNPRGLHFGPNGRLYVAEAGLGGTLTTVGTSPQAPPPLGPLTGGFTGRISRINPAGQRHTLVDGLPSSQTTPQTGSDVLGPSAIEFIGRRMYVLIEAGADKGLAGTFNGVFRVRPGGSLVTLANLSAHNQAVFDGIPDDDHGPDGNPYSMTALDGALYVTEANHGAVNQVNLDGTVTRLVDVAAEVGHITPTGIAAGPDGNLYMGVIGEFPYLDGTASLFQITPQGDLSLLDDNMTAVVDLEFDSQGRLYALETFSGNLPAPPFFNPSSGRIRRLTDSGWETVVSGLTNPTAMTFGPDQHLYVSNKGHGFGTSAGLGEILEIDLGDGTAASSAEAAAAPRWSVQIGTAPHALTNEEGLPQDQHLAATGNNTSGWNGGGVVTLGILSQVFDRSQHITLQTRAVEGGIIGEDGSPVADGVYLAPSQEIGDRVFEVTTGETFYLIYQATVVNSNVAGYEVGGVFRLMLTFEALEGRHEQPLVLWADFGSGFFPFTNEGVMRTNLHTVG